MTFDNKCRDCRHRTGQGAIALCNLKAGNATNVRIISKMSMAQIAACRFYKQVPHAVTD